MLLLPHVTNRCDRLGGYVTVNRNNIKNKCNELKMFHSRILYCKLQCKMIYSKASVFCKAVKKGVT